MSRKEVEHLCSLLDLPATVTDAELTAALADAAAQDNVTSVIAVACAIIKRKREQGDRAPRNGHQPRQQLENVREYAARKAREHGDTADV